MSTGRTALPDVLRDRRSYINESVAIARLHVAGRGWESTMIDAQERGAFPVLWPVRRAAPFGRS